MSDVFKALADPTRREILVMLSQKSASVNHIAEQFNMSRPAVSKHLKILNDSALISIKTDEEDGRQRNCYAQLEALAEFDAYLSELRSFWQSKLTGLGDYLTKQSGNKQ
jgi:DNA-binding transcriptional ArsR family regulator